MPTTCLRFTEINTALRKCPLEAPSTFDARPARCCSRRPGHPRSAMQAAQQQELEAMTDMFNKCALALSALQRVSSSLSRQPRVAAG